MTRQLKFPEMIKDDNHDYMQDFYEEHNIETDIAIVLDPDGYIEYAANWNKSLRGEVTKLELAFLLRKTANLVEKEYTDETRQHPT